jgi:hypothetical protein
MRLFWQEEIRIEIFNLLLEKRFPLFFTKLFF